MSRKSVLMSGALAGALSAGALLAGSAEASVVPVVYTLVDQGFGQSSATGTITTDGKIGMLSLSDITAYDITLSVGAATAEITEANGNITGLSGSAVSATSTALLFDVASSGLFVIGSFSGADISGYCLSTSSSCNGQISGEEEIAVNTNNDSQRAITGSFEFATAATATSAVPEPSTWALMLLGFAGMGFAGFRKKASARGQTA